MFIRPILNQNYCFKNCSQLKKSDDSFYKNTQLLDFQTAQAIKSQYLSFGRGPFYAFDKDGNYKKYVKQVDAVNDLNLSVAPTRVSACVRGKVPSLCGYYFIDAKEIEQRDEYGNMILDDKKVQNALYERKNTRSIYAIDENGNCVRYNSRLEAFNSLKLSGTPSNISACLIGKTKKVDGYIFVYPWFVETENLDGTRSVDEEKVKAVIKSHNPVKEIETPIEKKCSRYELYAIDKNGNYQKFHSNNDASIALGIKPASISNCLSKKSYTAGDYVFVRAVDIENSDGDVDNQKIKNIIKTSFERYSFYAIDKYGTKTKFLSQTDAVNALGVSSPRVSECLSGKRKQTCGYTFEYVSETGE